MSEQEMREKVIKGMEYCMSDGSECYEPSNGKCPYYKDDVSTSACTDDLFYDVYALLKAQEPRVMTLEEATQLKRDTVIWFEHEESQEVRPRIINYANNEGIVFTDGGEWRFLEDDYGERWRIWTSRPTDEQREKEPWNG